MSHEVKKSLAGTDMEYYEVDDNEGLRVRKYSNTQLRIHVLKDAPKIDARTRFDKGKESYFAMDVDTEALKTAIRLSETGQEAHFAGIENVLAALVVRADELDEKKAGAVAQQKEAEKVIKQVAEEKAKLVALKSRVTNGMKAYNEGRKLLVG